MSDLSLEIYHLDVNGGDSTAIIVKDLKQETDKGGKTIYSLLIDAGSEGKGSAYLKAYLQKHLTLSFDCIIATHYHQDHIQGFKQAEIKFKKFLDNGAYADGKGNTFTPRNGIGNGAQTTIFDSYKEQVQIQVNNNGATRIPIPFIEKGFDLKTAKPLELELVKGAGMTLTCYCANGILARGDDILDGQRKEAKNKSVSPNDVSLAFVLEWGDFRYFTAGDLSGDHTLSSYYNIEESLVKYLTDGPLKDKKITVFKASHHGSEHSNHASLLTAFKPETIIVCCNIMKQVPSPEFLKRLDSYFKTNTNAKAVFTNTMKIFRNDDRYEPLQNIEKSIASGNVEFKGMGDGEEIATNLGIKCAVVRRRVLDGNPVAYDNKNMPPGMSRIDMNGYDILLPKRDDDEANLIASTVKFRSYDIKKSWNDDDLHEDFISEGFTSQAEAMVEWVKKDKTQTVKQGMDYIKEHYPGLDKIIDKVEEGELERALITEMERMFNESFTTGTIYQDDHVPNSDNQLTSDEKRAFHAIMINNYHQAAFNTVIKWPNTSYGSYDKENSWNRKPYPEPYSGSTSGEKEKRRMVYVPSARYPKRGGTGKT